MNKLAWYSLSLVIGLALQVGAAAQPVPHASEEMVLKNGSTMLFEQNVAVPLPDGATVFANVFRPKVPGHYPVIMAQGPYGKDATFQAAYAGGWAAVIKTNPRICDASSCRFIRLGTHRPGTLGGRWLCRPHGGCTRCRLHTRVSRHALASRNSGLRGRDRMGRNAALVRMARSAFLGSPTWR